MNDKRMEYIHRPVRTGALTLLITAVLICLAVLAVLALATAQADLAMAKKALTGLQDQAAVETAGQECLAELDAALKNGRTAPEGFVPAEDGSISTSFSVNGNTLQIVAILEEPTADAPAAYRIRTWQLTTQWEPDQKLDLWNGM
nr:hypothetical protein [uncultured Gemmiger sp.]